MRKWLCMAVCFLLIMTMAVTVCAVEEEQVGLTEECTHSVAVWQSAGDGTHSGSCTLCEDTVTENHTWGTPVNTATCTADGQKTYTCTKCHATKTEAVAATGHSFGNWTTEGDSGHKRVCTACSAVETGAHSQSSETITKQASCKEEGKRDLVCICGHIVKKDEVIPKTAHSYGSWTHTEEKHSRTCSGCGNAELADHKFDKVTVVKTATCAEEGQTTKTCSTCGYTSAPEKTAKLTTHTYDNACDDTCNVCGNKREAGHKPGKTWSSSGIGHWHECSVCKEKLDEGKHVPGPAATEDRPQVCLTCDYVMTPKKNHVHEYDKQWSKDKTGHWHTCTGCDEQKNFAAHDYDDVCDDQCNICGYKNEDAHDFTDSWHTTEKNHQPICRVCGKKGQSEAHIPGIAATEENDQLCTVCGYVLESASEHDHVFGDQWLNNGQSHWQECECGQQTIPEVHDWDEGKKEKGGKLRFTCRECGLERTEIPEKSGFPWWILFTVLGLLLAGGAGVFVFYWKMPKQTGRFSRKD